MALWATDLKAGGFLLAFFSALLKDHPVKKPPLRGSKLIKTVITEQEKYITAKKDKAKKAVREWESKLH